MLPNLQVYQKFYSQTINDRVATEVWTENLPYSHVDAVYRAIATRDIANASSMQEQQAERRLRVERDARREYCLQMFGPITGFEEYNTWIIILERVLTNARLSDSETNYAVTDGGRTQGDGIHGDADEQSAHSKTSLLAEHLKQLKILYEDIIQSNVDVLK